MSRFQIVEDENDAWGFDSKLIDTHNDNEEIWFDRWQADCPEDLTLDRLVGNLVAKMNELQREVERVEEEAGAAADRCDCGMY